MSTIPACRACDGTVTSTSTAPTPGRTTHTMAARITPSMASKSIRVTPANASMPGRTHSSSQPFFMERKTAPQDSSHIVAAEQPTGTVAAGPGYLSPSLGPGRKWRRGGGREHWPLKSLLADGHSNIGSTDRREIDRAETIEDPYGPVEEAMVSGVVTVRPEDKLESIMEHLEHYTGLPVVDESGHCVGVVSDKDVVSFVNGANVQTEEAAEAVLQNPVSVVMSSPAMTIKEHAPIAFAAALMLQHKIHRLPVVDSEGVVVGIVTRTDIYKPLMPKVNPLYARRSSSRSGWDGIGEA